MAVALGIVDLALGTDTAGSGRVPAAFNGIVGLKPTRGLVPATGVVPACASLDCVTVFARTLPEAEEASYLASPSGRELPALPSGPRPLAWPSRRHSSANSTRAGRRRGRGRRGAARRRRGRGAHARPHPVHRGGGDALRGRVRRRALHGGGKLCRQVDQRGGSEYRPDRRRDHRRARDIPAHQLFADQDRLAALRTRALAELGDADALLLPTAPGHPTLAEVAADPLGADARLGRFTNSTNLFDLAAVAVPAGLTPAALPFGVMLIGPAFTDERLARSRRAAPAGPADRGGRRPPVRPAAEPPAPVPGRGVGTYDHDGTRLRLHALSTTPPKPGLVHGGESAGAGIEAEVWRLPAAGLGRLLADLPRPMALGRVELADGTHVPGFLCEPAALEGAEDITEYGGWRGYLRTRA